MLDCVFAGGRPKRDAARGIRSAAVIEALAELMAVRGVPDHIRSDTGPDRARVAWAGGSQDALHRAWVAVGERLASFNGQSGDEPLDRGLIYTLLEARALTQWYRRTCNRARPRRSLVYPAAGARGPVPADPVPALVGPT